HRHVARLAGGERLRGEAEAFGLAEVAGRARRRDRGHGIADDRALAVVAGVEHGVVLLAGAHLHRRLFGMERPRQPRVHAAVELHRDDAVGLARLEGRGALAADRALLNADAEHLLAGDAVHRHQREGEGEGGERHAHHLQRAAAVALARVVPPAVVPYAVDLRAAVLRLVVLHAHVASTPLRMKAT